MNRFLIVIALVGILFSGCNQERKKEEALYKVVMDIHDEVMPEMGTLRSLAKKIEAKADSLDSVSVDSPAPKAMKDAVEDLKKANESMMVWMRQFEQLEQGTPHDEAMKYLEEQKILIQKVKEDMLNAKAEGEKWVK